MPFPMALRIADASLLPPRSIFEPAPGYLWRPISDRPSVPLTGTAITLIAQNSYQDRASRTIPNDCSVIAVCCVITCWGITQSGSIGENDEYMPYTAAAAVEVNSKSWPFTFNGQREIRITPGWQSIWSDPLYVPGMTATTLYKIRSWRQTDFIQPSGTFTVSASGVVTSAAVTNSGAYINQTGAAGGPTALTATGAAASSGLSGATFSPVVTFSGGTVSSVTVTASGTGGTAGTFALTFANGLRYILGAAPDSVSPVSDQNNRNTNLADVTTATGTLAGNNAASSLQVQLYGAQIVSSGAMAPCIGMIGSSSMAGTNDVFDLAGRKCWPQRAVSPYHGTIQMGSGSNTVAEFITRNSGRLALMRPGMITHLLSELVGNDVIGGASLATVQANIQNYWGMFLRRGIKVVQATIQPVTTGAWTTTGGQTVTAQEAVRVGFNDWLRANYVSLGLTAVVDVCAQWETSLDSGFWVNPNNALETGSQAYVTPNIASGGLITSYTVQASGTSYSVAPTVTITTPSGGVGAGATALCVTSSGTISSLTVTASGSGYSAANPPFVFLSGVLTVDGKHGTHYAQDLIVINGLCAPTLFTV